MPNSEVVDKLAIYLWKSFEYTLPISPRSFAEIVIKYIESQGYEIVGEISE